MATRGAMAKQKDGAGTVIVVNSQLRIRRYPKQYVPDRFKEMPPDKRRVDLKVVELRPGANSVDREEWAQVEEAVTDDLGSGVLRVLEKPIPQLPEADAIRIVKSTIDEPILLGAQAGEKREKVKKAIRRQLGEIRKLAHEPKGDDE